MTIHSINVYLSIITISFGWCIDVPSITILGGEDNGDNYIPSDDISL